MCILELLILSSSPHLYRCERVFLLLALVATVKHRLTASCTPLTGFGLDIKCFLRYHDLPSRICHSYLSSYDRKRLRRDPAVICWDISRSV